MPIHTLNNSTSSNLVIGNKAKGLLFLQQIGWLIPETYVIDFQSLQELKDQASIEKLLENWQAVKANKDQKWSVRSSSTIEDGKEQSFAGQFRTELNVNNSQLAEAILKVKSAYQNIAGAFKYGIIIQQMIEPDLSAVLFTHDPIKTELKGPIINVLPGTGDELVSGEMTGFNINFNQDGFTNSDLDEVYNGQKGSEILKKIKPFLDEIHSKTNQLLKAKNNEPQDLEFCIADGKIYWLQVRPMTALTEEDEGKIECIWDNIQAEGNFPGLTSPLSISFANETLSASYKEMARFIGCSKKVMKKAEKDFNHYMGEINGRLYYNLTSWQNTLYQAPFGKKLAQQILKVWGTDPIDFHPPPYRNNWFRRQWILMKFLAQFFRFKKHQREYEHNYKALINKFNKVELGKLNHDELVKFHQDAKQKFAKLWLTPALNGFFVLVLFNLLQKKIERSGIGKKYPNFFNDVLYSQEEVISVKLVKDFRMLVQSIQNNNKLFKLFKEEKPQLIYRQLTDHPELKKKIENYIEKYGVRTTDSEMKIETVNYREDPVLFIAFLQKNIHAKFEDHQAKLNWKSVLSNEKYLGIFKRWYFHFLIKRTINVVRNRENYRFYRAEVYDLVRRIMRQIDAILLKEGWVENKRDSIYLKLDEITTPFISGEYKELIRKRKSAYESYENLLPFTRYYQVNGKLKPVQSQFKSNTEKSIKGVGCCSGICQGEVKIIRSKDDIDDGIEGYILVGGNFEPGWINLFSKASGIISERGNLLSHTAILCRELGIPSIVGAKNVTKMIKEGDKIIMDGAKGEISILK